MDQRVEGAATRIGGQIQEGLGKLTGDGRLELEGKLNEVKGKAIETYGQAIDGLEKLAEKAPADFQEPARRGIQFAREKPLVTTGIVAGLLTLLIAGGRRRRS